MIWLLVLGIVLDLLAIYLLTTAFASRKKK